MRAGRRVRPRSRRAGAVRDADGARAMAHMSKPKDSGRASATPAPVSGRADRRRTQGGRGPEATEGKPEPIPQAPMPIEARRLSPRAERADRAERGRDPRETSAEVELEGFFAEYDAPTAKLGRTLRTRLRARLPGLLELVYVYESQRSLVISYSPSQAGADAVCAVALYPHGVKLFLSGGAPLSKSDPKKLLRGRGKSVRHVVLSSIADFERPEIDVLMAAALELTKVRLDARAKGSTIIKAGEQKQRARRAGKAARPTAGRRSPSPGR